MFREHLQYLVCPNCKINLSIQATKEEGEHIIEGKLVCAQCSKTYPIIDSIPRFVPQSNYADSFGFEWNMHKKTQHDSASGVEASKKRFYEETRWNKPTNNESLIILEAGCGSGRFTPFALEAAGGGVVISFDYSSAIDASARTNVPSKNLLLLQASIFELPLAPLIDRCFCFGVLQHTPSAKDAIAALVSVLKSGGELVCDHYPFNKNTPFNTKYWVRPITTRIPHKKLYEFGKKYIDFMWPVFKMNRECFPPKVANRLNWRLLVPDYTSAGLSEEMLKEWAYLDFFDMLSPKYDRPVRLQTFHRYLVESGLDCVETKAGYNGWEGRGIKR